MALAYKELLFLKRVFLILHLFPISIEFLRSLNIIIGSPSNSKNIFISSMIKKALSAKLLNAQNCIKLFKRTNDEPVLHRVYQDSVNSIIEQRNFLQLAPDTVFLAIEILRGYLRSQHNINVSCTKPLYLACISLAAKINEITPPMMEELEEVQDFFVQSEEIVKMEQQILTLCDFNLPITENILTYVEAVISDEEQKMQNSIVKALYETIHDPIFINITPKQTALAVILLTDPENNLIKSEITKTIDCVVRRMRHLTKGKVMPSFKDLNINSS